MSQYGINGNKVGYSCNCGSSYNGVDNNSDYNLSYSLAMPLHTNNSAISGDYSQSHFSNFSGQYTGSHFNGYNSLNIYNSLHMRTGKIVIDYHNPENMLNSFREEAQFIADAKDIEELIKEAFSETMGEIFPEHITVAVLKEEAFKKAFEHYSSRSFSNNVQGFAIHNKNRVFVKAGKLDKVMVVLGHEIGHILTSCLPSMLNEEAKAFSFERAWLNTIVNKNIGDIADNINLNFTPASNGVHDIAFRFVQRRSKEKHPLSLFFELSNGFDSVVEPIEF